MKSAVGKNSWLQSRKLVHLWDLVCVLWGLAACALSFVLYRVPPPWHDYLAIDPKTMEALREKILLALHWNLL